ncbi:hypothetical protein [Colwellia psychrerythraea]|uniref:Uncharacterized protein n=1 Tax=Colwellia psychrerythraea TaxID=28229 RepID=A0A099KYE9_COLPS|nr:hypothetical protein [Colwellia psychrerythraea]KGJ94658.1 hypothetical protein ND2E_1847 [Colwellia psychrerythraea]
MHFLWGIAPRQCSVIKAERRLIAEKWQSINEVESNDYITVVVVI